MATWTLGFCCSGSKFRTLPTSSREGVGCSKERHLHDLKVPVVSYDFNLLRALRTIDAAASDFVVISLRSFTISCYLARFV